MRQQHVREIDGQYAEPKSRQLLTISMTAAELP